MSIDLIIVDLMIRFINGIFASHLLLLKFSVFSMTVLCEILIYMLVSEINFRHIFCSR